jgi:DNA-binding CsgD family transcriptional regulator
MWLAAGLRTAEIAHRMRIETVTVGYHLQRARRKLGARTREQALVIAVRAGHLGR